VEFRILGPLEVSDGGRPLALGGAKQRAALAVMLLHANQVVSRDRLIDGVWGDSPPPTAAHTLDAYMSRLRKELGEHAEPPRVVNRRPGYVLRVETDELDLHRFERLLAQGRQAAADGSNEQAATAFREALALFSGPPLEELAHARFAEAESARLAELGLAALEERLDADLALGRHLEVTPELRKLVDSHPLRERLWAQLILALYRSGRQADALTAYDQIRRRLATELGVDPGRSLQQLRQRILGQDAALDLAAEPAAAPAVAVLAPAHGGRRTDGDPRAHAPLPSSDRRDDAEPALSGQLTAPPNGTGGRRAWLAVATVVVLAATAALGRAMLAHDREGDHLAIRSGVTMLDAATGAAAAHVRLGKRPTDVASGAGAVWVSNAANDSVSRIDSNTHEVVPIKVGRQPSGITVGAGAVWVANGGEATVTRISTATPFDVTQIEVGPGPSDVVVAVGSVWVTNSLDASVTQIDPRSNQVTRTVPVGVGPVGIAFGAGSLWVANQGDDTVSRLDPASGGLVDAPLRVGHGPIGLAFGAGAVWVTNNIDGSLSRIELDDLSVTTLRLAAGGGAYGVAVSGGAVWVSNEYGGTVTRLDAKTFTMTGAVPVRGTPLGLTASHGHVWLASAEDDATHRGGVLRIAADDIDDGQRVLDPTDTYCCGDLWRLLVITNDGLVGFRRAAGVLGTQLVPDLATSLPTPTDGGRTYVFHLRHGVRYSTGATVQAVDIRHGIERTLQHGRGPWVYYAAVKGAPACHDAPDRCDLSAGIVTDERAHTVTFHLTRPDPEFLYRLALPFADAVPVEVPVSLAEGVQVPATGPYRVAAYTPRRTDSKGTTIGLGRLELVRNERFRVWSAAAQPDGYPDRIVLDIGLTPARAAARVAQGRADLTWHDPPPGTVSSLAARYPTQLHSNAGKFTYYLALNTTIPPFNDRRARQAVAYWINRSDLAGDPTGTGYGQVTCQVLPPNFYGHVTYCPYTRNPGDSRPWNSPDLGTAQRLVRESGTRGMRVSVVSPRSNPGVATLRRVVESLDNLGYRASLDVVDDWPGDGFQVALAGWGADYPAASNDVYQLGTCHDDSYNLSKFCELQPQIDQVLATQSRDPGAANQQWAAMDQALVDTAPIVPFSTTVRHDFTSRRVGNYQYNPQYEALVAQLWVR
jgi:YVTN family beta-propeller protein